MKDELPNAETDTNIYKADSCRSTSSSNPENIGMSLSEILNEVVSKLPLLSKSFMKKR